MFINLMKLMLYILEWNVRFIVEYGGGGGHLVYFIPGEFIAFFS